MCGIAGYFCNRGDRKNNRAILEKMSALLAHRGPDGTGLFVQDQIGIAHRRLAILDLSDKASQPMSNEDNSIWMVVNGEFYNYRELKQDLLRKGHVFKSRTDSEVLLHLYEEEGLNAVSFLEGMFAFAIWDKKKRRLFLGRDRVGEKPLYTAEVKDSFWFASEPNALLSHPNISREPDLEGLSLGLHFLSIPPPRSAWKMIQKVPLASCLTIDDSGISCWRYWNIDLSEKKDWSMEKAAVTCRELLVDVVNSQLMADVPVAVTLSGGLDSSGIAAILSERLGTSMAAFTLGSLGDNNEEFKRAERVARRYGMDHRKVFIGPECLSLLPEVLKSYGEPMGAFPSVYAHQLAIEMAKEAKVVITGNGADEIFGGYEHYNKILQTPHSSNPEKVWADRVTLNVIQDFAHLVSGDLAQVFRKTKFHEIYEHLFIESNAGDNLLDGLLYQDLMSRSSHSIVSIPDSSGMANSIELRSPFLSQKIIEFAFSLPTEFKVPDSFDTALNKAVLKEAFKPILPKENLLSPKIGFGASVPWQKWIVGPWRSSLYDILFNGTLASYGWIDRFELGRVWTENIRREGFYSELLWIFISLAVWVELELEQVSIEGLRERLVIT
ncbi:asparagine synthase (glutamine-hydrolyzing) [Patescibacteria group bacterium]|nr:asparagine synthase (glutamine-hydrolyzing) [Patescibacteria group bacterium]